MWPQSTALEILETVTEGWICKRLSSGYPVKFPLLTIKDEVAVIQEAIGEPAIVSVKPLLNYLGWP